jgi:NADPH:quinone reductase-like Zn-dependent oxidoreductase
MSMTYQDIAIEKYGAARTLKHRADLALDPPGDGEMTIDVKYSGINFADIQMRLGFYPGAPPKPFVPGYEVSGVVEAVGKGVSEFRPGDPVIAGTYFGGYASKVTVPSFQAFALPQDYDLAQGAALPVNYFTAQIALFEMARIRRGDRVLIECATGGVGTLAIQMARHVGAHCVGLTTSAHKKDYIEALGAEAHTREEFYRDSSMKNFDLILNASGGAELKKQMPRLGITGRMVCIGLNSGVKDGTRNLWRMGKAALQTPKISVLKLFDTNSGIFAINALLVLQDEAWIRRLTEGVKEIDDMKLLPHVGKVFEADAVADAHEYLQTKQAKGKVLLSW